MSLSGDNKSDRLSPAMKYAPLILMALAAMIRLAYLALYQSMPEWQILTVDNLYHHNWAQDIASGNVFGDTTYFRAPGYVYCLAILYFLFGTSLWVGRLFGMAIGLCSIWLTFRTGAKFFSRRTGLIAATAQCLLPMAWYFESELLLDPLFMLLLQLSLYWFLSWQESNQSRQAAWCGLFLGLASITRPTALIYVAAIGVIGIYRALQKKSLSQFKQPATIVLVAFLVILPISVRNLVVGSEVVPIASQGGINFYIGNNAVADGLSATMPDPLGHNWSMSQIKYIAEKQSAGQLSSGEISRFWFFRALGEITDDPLHFLRLLGLKFYSNFSNREISNNRDLGSFAMAHLMLRYNPFSFSFLFALAAIGGIMAFRARESKDRYLVLLILIYAIVTSLFFFNSRFRLPLIPSYTILFALGIEGLRNSFRSGAVRGGLATSVAVVFWYLSHAAFVSPTAGPPDLTNSVRGSYLASVADYAGAVESHRRARRQDSTFFDVNLNLGTDFLKLGQEDSARHYFEQEIRFHPNRHKAYVNLASLFLINGHTAEAEQLAFRALKIAPYDIAANRILVRSLLDKDSMDISGVIEFAFAAAEATDRNLFVLNDIGMRLSRRGYREQAIEIFEMAVASTLPPIETDDMTFSRDFKDHRRQWRRQKAVALNELSYLHGSSGALGRAVEYALESIAIDSLFADAYVNLISGHLFLGHTSTADSVLAEAMERFPENQQLRKFRQPLR